MKCLYIPCALALVSLTVGCVSTRTVSYGDGSIKTSPVSYVFTAPPALAEVGGETYRVAVDGDPTKGQVKAFDRKGMHATTSTADVEVQIQMGRLRQGEPGAIKVGKQWAPAFTVSLPYEFSIRRGTQRLLSGSSVYENALTFKQGYRFPTREKAIQAIDTIRKLGQKGIEKQTRENAVTHARGEVSSAASGLFQPRRVSMEVPVVRDAAGLDLEPCYQMLAKASSPEQVREALRAYEALGTDHKKADGSPNNTANYGVACGIAACKLMLRDLSGAWDTSKTASRYEERGEEADRIRFVIYQQEKVTGERVIPEADRARLAEQERMAGALQRAFAAPGR